MKLETAVSHSHTDISLEPSSIRGLSVGLPQAWGTLQQSTELRFCPLTTSLHLATKH